MVNDVMDYSNAHSDLVTCSVMTSGNDLMVVRSISYGTGSRHSLSLFPRVEMYANPVEGVRLRERDEVKRIKE